MLDMPLLYMCTRLCWRHARHEYSKSVGCVYSQVQQIMSNHVLKLVMSNNTPTGNVCFNCFKSCLTLIALGSVLLCYCGTMVLYPVKNCHFYWFNKTLIDQQPGRKYRQSDQNRRILGRGEAQSAVVTKMQRKQDKNA